MRSLDKNNILDQIRKLFEEQYLSLAGEQCVRKLSDRSIDKVLSYIKMYLTLQAICRDKVKCREVFQEFSRNYEIEQSSEKKKPDEIIYESNMNILRNLIGRKRIVVSQIFSYSSKSTDLLDYIWLRSKGYLRKTSSGKLLITKNIYREELDHERKRSVSLSDIVKYLKEIPSSLWFKIIDQDFLKSLGNRGFLDIIDKFYGYNPRIDQRLREEVDKRIEKGWIPNWSEWRELEKMFKKTGGKLDRYMGPYSLEKLDSHAIESTPKDKILVDLLNTPLNERWRIVSKIKNNRFFSNILKELDPISLSIINNPYKFDRKLGNKIVLGKILNYYITYLLTREQSYLDYVDYLLDKIDPKELDPVFRPIYRSIVEKNYSRLLNYLGRRYSIETIEYLTYRVWSHISSREMDYELIWRAVRLGYDVLKHSIKGLDYIGRYRESSVSGRVSVKKTLYNYARYNYTVVRRYREKCLRVNALVDVSGSMLRYSTWAILSISSILPIVKNIVLFSDKTYLSKPPRSSSRKIIIDYLTKLFTEGFQGYTNISLAIRVLNRVSGERDIAIMFSDLEQTVRDTDPWIEAEKYLSRGKRRLIVFTTPRHSIETRERFIEKGVEVIVVNEPSRIPYLLKRRLNLKIRVNIFPFKSAEIK